MSKSSPYTDIFLLFTLLKSTDDITRDIASQLLHSKLRELDAQNLDQRKLLKELINYVQTEPTDSCIASANVYIYDHLYAALDKQYKKIKALEDQLLLAQTKICDLQMEILHPKSSL